MACSVPHLARVDTRGAGRSDLALARTQRLVATRNARGSIRHRLRRGKPGAVADAWALWYTSAMGMDARDLRAQLAGVCWLWATCAVCACGSAGSAEVTVDPPQTARPSPAQGTSKPVTAEADAPDGRGRVRLLVPGAEPREVQVEVVFTPADRQLGLMHRRAMGADAGMLFLFPREQQLSFWMKNTHLPLDMVFIRSDYSVLGVVENAEPHTLTSRRVPGLSQYVLEVHAGYARRHGIAEGSRVEFVDVADEQAAVRH